MTTPSFVDTPLVNATTYYYVVTAGNSMGESPYSNEVSATNHDPDGDSTGTSITINKP